jgi:hypothetical protein
VVVWKVPSGEVLQNWQFPGSVATVTFSADGRYLAAGNFNGTVYILRLTDAR